MSKVAITGDGHGRLRAMYNRLEFIRRYSGLDITQAYNLGDLQTPRNEADLRQMPIKQKHRKMGDFPFYLEKGAVPLETHFLGGNHENYLWLSQMPSGGELIPGLSYLGRSGTFTVQGVKFGFVSGNYSPRDYNNPDLINSPQHFRGEDLKKVIDSGKLDVLLLHDWPSARSLSSASIPGSVSDPNLLRQLAKRGIGNDPFYELIRETQPKWVFSGHVHVPFTLEAKIDGRTTKFVSLNQIGRENSIAVFDLSTMTLDGVYGGQYSLFDIIPRNRVEKVSSIFRHLEEDRLTEAEQGFRLILGDSNQETRSLAHYGLGVVYFKRYARNNSDDQKDLDSSIMHLKESLGRVEHADTYLVLGHALKTKMAIECTKGQIVVDSISRLIQLANESISAFKSALSLNPEYLAQVEEAVQPLELQRADLIRRDRLWARRN